MNILKSVRGYPVSRSESRSSPDENANLDLLEREGERGG